MRRRLKRVSQVRILPGHRERASSGGFPPRLALRRVRGRATRVPLESTRSPHSLAGGLSLTLANHGSEPISDGPVAVAGHVLRDQRGARAAVAHAGHQLTGAGAGGRGQGVSRVAEIVEMQLCRDARRVPGRDPVVPEVAQPELAAPWADEDVSVAAGRGELFQVACDVVEQLPQTARRAGSLRGHDHSRQSSSRPKAAPPTSSIPCGSLLRRDRQWKTARANRDARHRA